MPGPRKILWTSLSVLRFAGNSSLSIAKANSFNFTSGHPLLFFWLCQYSLLSEILSLRPRYQSYPLTWAMLVHRNCFSSYSRELSYPTTFYYAGLRTILFGYGHSITMINRDIDDVHTYHWPKWCTEIIDIRGRWPRWKVLCPLVPGIRCRVLMQRARKPNLLLREFLAFYHEQLRVFLLLWVGWNSDRKRSACEIWWFLRTSNIWLDDNFINNIMTPGKDLWSDIPSLISRKPWNLEL